MATVSYGRRLGAGGFSHAVAIKQLHPHLASNAEVVAMFMDEARLAARVVHANVVSILDIVQQGQDVWAVMQYIEGDSLARLMKRTLERGRGVPVGVALSIAIDLLAGLEAAHTATDPHGEPLGIVHRDVSPQNVLVGADGVARVLDFGVAKARGRLHETQDGQVKGKLSYMAPEQLGGEASVSTDVYAAAIVLWELLAGRRLFDAATEVGVVGQVMAGATVPPSHHADVPAELDAIVMAALSLDPSKRFASASEMARALSDAFAGKIARRADVAAWVMETAGEIIAERRARAVAMASRPVASVDEHQPPSAPGASPTPAWGSTVVMPRSSSANVPQPVVISGSFPSMKPSRWRSTAVAAALALVGAAFGLRAIARPSEAKDPTAVTSAAAAPDHAVTAQPVATQEPAVVAAPEAAAVAAPVVASPASAHRGGTKGAAPRAKGTVKASQPAAAPPVASVQAAVTSAPPPVAAEPVATSAAECDPPYVVDASGFRRYKRSCIR